MQRLDEHALGRPRPVEPAPAAVRPFASPSWLPDGHSQTIWPYLLRRPAVPYRRERVAAPDGDFWDFDWLVPASVRRDAPLVVLLHGLEGSSASHYARALMVALMARGWRGVVPHFRGCSGEPNLMPRAYHSGDHAEARAMLQAIRARVDPGTVIYAVGISVGGSVLLNWLGRAGRDAADDGQRGGRGVDAARPHGRGHRDRQGAQSHLHVQFPEHAEAEEPRDGEAAPRAPRRGEGEACADHVRFRRCRDVGAARLRRRAGLLDARVGETLARRRARADAGAQCPERPVRAAGIAARARRCQRGRAAGATRRRADMSAFSRAPFPATSIGCRSAC